MAVTRIYRPAGVTADSFTTLRTSEDGEENAGTAFGGYGMQFTPQGLARLMRFVLDGAVVDGTPVLRPERLAETMFEDPDDVGAPMNYFDWSYHHGMWGYPLDRWGCSGHVPVMFGISGITAIFAPNEAVYFAVNDRQEQPVVAVLDQLDAIAPLCPD